MGVQAALGSDLALAFDECTPYHADRDYTARSMERTHRWLDRCVAWHEREGPSRQAVFGIVQGGVHEDLRRASAERVSAAAIDGLAIGGTLGRDKAEMRGVVAMTTPHLAPTRRATCSGSASPTTSSRGSRWGSTSSTARSRPAWRDTASRWPRCRRPVSARRSAPRAGAGRGPLVEGCPCPTCEAHTRAYVHYLSRAEELTGVRLLAIHNLAYLERLMRGAREAIAARALRRLPARDLGGEAPWELAARDAPPAELTACGS